MYSQATSEGGSVSTNRVFLSSTGRDLAEYRQAVYRAIEGVDGDHWARMGDFGARDWGGRRFMCWATVTGCGLLMGIVGHL